jgi:Flp pilus assembly protein TadD
LVLGFPGRDIPFFTNSRHGFMGGSPFGYIAQQMNLMAQASGGLERAAARVRALDMCEALLRRQIRPDVVRALRARVHLAADCPELALLDLEFAHTAFAANGVVDAGTSLLLGQQELVAGSVERSRVLLAEAAAAEPDNALVWRQLGVALAEAQEFEPAREAMETALALDPASADGWYNLGLLMYRNGDLDSAAAHLEKAWALDPEDGRVQSLLQTLDTVRRQRKVAAGVH